MLDIQAPVKPPTAIELAARVRTRELRPLDAVRASLSRIHELDPQLNAFQHVMEESALQEAAALETRSDLSQLPLAGVPIAIKDNLNVVGAPTRYGSPATPSTLAVEHHEVVRRVLAAGAIVVGKTRMPEMGLWATTDGAWGITRNPWKLDRTPGGSSGGSAAAVAAGMVPITVGNDGLGSIRIPSACCGLFGIKPGLGLVPALMAANDWFGFTEHGPIATTVTDAATLLAVMADQPDLALVREPTRSLRIALSVKSPAFGIPVDEEHVRATFDIAQLLREAGHSVLPFEPPYSTRIGLAIVGHWVAATALEITPIDSKKLESRTVTHARWGPLADRLGLTGPKWRAEWREQLDPLFREFDVILTPTLAQPPIAAQSWANKSWVANLHSNSRYAPFSAPWNLAGYPAASVPAGMHSGGTPIGVQLVALPGLEGILLGLARTIERLRPWPRHAPIASQ